MKSIKFLILTLALLALPVAASAYTISIDDLVNGGIVGSSTYTGVSGVTITASGGSGTFDTLTQGGYTGLGVAGNSKQEIQLGEAITFAFQTAQVVDVLNLAFLYPINQYDDYYNDEIATITASSGGVSYTYTLLADDYYTGVWSGPGSVTNLDKAKEGDAALWSLLNPFGDLAVDSIILTVVQNTFPKDNSDYTFYSMSTTNATPIPGAVWLLGAGLMGLFGMKRRKAARALQA